MSNTDHYSHFFTIVIGLYFLLHYRIANGSGYDFAEIQYVNDVWRSDSSDNPDTFTVGQKITEIGHDHFGELCAAAAKFLSMSEEKFEMDFTDARMIPSTLKIFGDDEIWTNPFQVLWCEATPQFWIRVGLNRELILMLKFKLFAIDTGYSFDIEYIESDPVPCLNGGKCGVYEDVGVKTTQLYVCTTAIERITGDPIEMQTAEPPSLEGNVKLFQFKSTSGYEGKRVMLACPSHPPVYVYYGDTEKNVKVLVKRMERTWRNENVIK